MEGIGAGAVGGVGVVIVVGTTFGEVEDTTVVGPLVAVAGSDGGNVVGAVVDEEIEDINSGATAGVGVVVLIHVAGTCYPATCYEASYYRKGKTYQDATA